MPALASSLWCNIKTFTDIRLEKSEDGIAKMTD